MSMRFFVWIFLGVMSGVASGFITPRKDGVVEDILLGTIGALTGGFLANYFEQIHVIENVFYEYLLVILCISILIGIGKLLRRHIRE